MTPQDRMNAAAQGQTLPLSLIADLNIRAAHTYLDNLGVPRFGKLKPYDKTLLERIIWLYHNCDVRPFIQSEGQSDD